MDKIKTFVVGRTVVNVVMEELEVLAPTLYDAIQHAKKVSDDNWIETREDIDIDYYLVEELKENDL